MFMSPMGRMNGLPTRSRSLLVVALDVVEHVAVDCSLRPGRRGMDGDDVDLVVVAHLAEYKLWPLMSCMSRHCGSSFAMFLFWMSRMSQVPALSFSSTQSVSH